MRNSHSKINFRRIPSTIKELLKLLCGQDVTLILDAHDGPENVEIEAIIGDLLVAETTNNRFKFVDIDCICAVIVDREDLLEGIFNCENEEAAGRQTDRHECDRVESDRHENDNQDTGNHEIQGTRAAGLTQTSPKSIFRSRMFDDD
jgi:hypothetical protein